MSDIDDIESRALRLLTLVRDVEPRWQYTDDGARFLTIPELERLSEARRQLQHEVAYSLLEVARFAITTTLALKNVRRDSVVGDEYVEGWNDAACWIQELVERGAS